MPRGSSPLARGLQDGVDGGVAIRGIIPACAGFTRRAAGRRGDGRDHPRLRGVYTSRPAPHGYGVGSSPLARGLRQEPVPRGPRAGIIPACAGFTGHAVVVTYMDRDHPRLRGVYDFGSCNIMLDRGSSPLARGLLLLRAVAAQVRGIIPACAGFTRSSLSARRLCRDHPRLRGVYRARPRSTAPGWGSSPLARGLPGGSVAPAVRSRIIPACAGFTRRRAPRSPTSPDHPRLRGVYHTAPALTAFAKGSSPLARGLLRLPCRPHSRAGIIPACAGFTTRPPP